MRVLTLLRIFPLLVTLLFVGCGSLGNQSLPDGTSSDEQAAPLDSDGDGADEATDCDDSDPLIHPDAEELCDGLDNNCDGVIDEDPVDGTTWYRDWDGDQAGDPAQSVRSCVQPEGYVSQGTDCDDGDPAINPGADEVCDGLDNDCDGAVDIGPLEGSTWYVDEDGDGYGDPVQTISACTQPEGYASESSDCDDTLASIYPGADELCDSLDNDCDGETDEDPSDPPTWYVDQDDDGYGDPTQVLSSCDQPEGYVEVGTDCDDGDASISPEAEEICNDGLDNNCDGAVDMAGPTSIQPLWYRDQDEDGYGNDEEITRACSQPLQFVATGGDCDDLDPTTYPGATELCGDALDNNCDGRIDEDDTADASTWYADADGDGYGNSGAEVQACHQPTGTAAVAGDCDDADAQVNPSAEEDCGDGLDNDCDGLVDGADTANWYLDQDQDGFGGSVISNTCEAPDGAVASAGDCDDEDPEIHPDADEQCGDGLDNDCDGAVDEDDAVDAATWYVDDDGDGFGAGAGLMTGCEGPKGTAANGEDCDDGEPTINPGALEVCDDANVDEDCNGLADDQDPGVDPASMETRYPDEDGDGYAADDSVQGITLCDPPDGYVMQTTDCDDGDPLVYPGAEELEDGIDQDCDGIVDNNLPHLDNDGDGYSANGGDCDDTDSSIFPGAPELFDAIDQDCDGDPGSSLNLGDAPVSYLGFLPGASAGVSMDMVQDTDGDQLDELLVGAPYHDEDGAEAGGAFLLLGRSAGWAMEGSLADEVVLRGAASGSHAGWSVTTVGDYNGDGLGDFAVGAPGYPANGFERAGAAYLLLGAETSWPSSQVLGDRAHQDAVEGDAASGKLGTTIFGIYSSVELGYSVAGGGDVNGDGYQDLLLGGPCETYSASCGSATGWLMILNGRQAALEEAAIGDLAKGAGSSDAAIGYSLALVGPSDEDGYDDILLGGAYNAEHYGSAVRVYGRPEIEAGYVFSWSGTNHYMGVQAEEWVGWRIDGAGDVDGDGLTDLLFGKQLKTEDQQLGYLMYGAMTDAFPDSGPLKDAADLVFVGDERHACPCAVSSAGDVDGDGLADILISASGSSIDEAEGGAVFLFFGQEERRTGEIHVDQADVAFIGATAGELAGFSVTGGEDLNGDGFDDLAIGAPGHSGGGANAGAVYIYFGFPR